MGVEVVRAARGSPSGCARGRSPRAASGPRSPSGGWRACPPSSPRTGRPARRRGRCPRSRSRGIRDGGDPRSGSGPPHGDRYSRRCRTCAWGVLLGLELAAPPRLASVVAPLRAPRWRRPARRPRRHRGPRPSPAARARCPRDGRGSGRAARAARSASAIARPRTSSFSHWSRWRTRIARCCWGRSGHRARRARRSRPDAARHDPQQLERGDDPVARGGVLADDHVAALLAAEAGARDQHRGEDVLVADRRPDDAGRPPPRPRAWSPPFESTDTTRLPWSRAPRAEPLEREDAEDLVAVHEVARPRPPRRTGRRRRRARTRCPRRRLGPRRPARPAPSRR